MPNYTKEDQYIAFASFIDSEGTPAAPTGTPRITIYGPTATGTSTEAKVDNQDMTDLGHSTGSVFRYIWDIPLASVAGTYQALVVGTVDGVSVIALDDTFTIDTGEEGPEGASPVGVFSL